MKNLLPCYFYCFQLYYLLYVLVKTIKHYMVNITGLINIEMNEHLLFQEI